MVTLTVFALQAIVADAPVSTRRSGSAAIAMADQDTCECDCSEQQPRRAHRSARSAMPAGRLATPPVFEDAEGDNGGVPSDVAEFEAVGRAVWRTARPLLVHAARKALAGLSTAL